MFKGSLSRIRTPEYDVRQLVPNLGLNLVDDPSALELGELTDSYNVLFTEYGMKQAPAFRYQDVAHTSYDTTSTQAMLAYFNELNGTSWNVFHKTNGETWLRKGGSDEYKLPNSMDKQSGWKISYARTKCSGTSYVTGLTSTAGGTETSLACTGGFTAGALAGKILKITSGDDNGQEYLVTTNTADFVYIDGRFNKAVPAGVTFSVYNPADAVILCCQGNDLILITSGAAAAMSAFSGLRFSSVCSYKGRVFMALTSTPNRILFSSPGVSTFPAANYFPVENTNDSYGALRPSDDRLIYFTNSKRTYILGDSPENFEIRDGGFETCDRNTNRIPGNAYVAGTVFFVSDRGIENASALDSVGAGDPAPVSAKVTRPGSYSPFGMSQKYGVTLANISTALAAQNNRLFCFIGDQTGDTTRCYVLDLRAYVQSGRAVWSYIDLPHYVNWARFDDYTNRVVVCMRNTPFFLDETTTQYDTANVTTNLCAFETGLVNFGDFGRPQNVYKVRIRAKVRGTYDVAMSARTRANVTAASGTYSVASGSTTDVLMELMVNKRTNQLKFRFEKSGGSTNDLFEPYLIETFTISEPKPK